MRMTPEQRIASLANSRVRTSQLRAARSPLCPPEALARFVAEGDPHLRALALQHPAVPAEVLQEHFVAALRWITRMQGVAWRRAEPAWTWSDYLTTSALLANPAVGSAWLMEAVEAGLDGHLRRIVLANEQCPAGLLTIMLGAPDTPTRMEAARFGCLTPAHQAQALADRSPRVRKAAVANDRMQVAVLDAHAQRETVVSVLQALVPRVSDGQRQLVLDRLGTRSRAVLSRYLVASQSTNEEQLVAACMDARPWIRRVADANAATPEEGHVLVALQRGAGMRG